jgi:hypothetical protein
MKFGEISTIIYHEGYQIPENQDCMYLIGGNGTFMYKKFGILESLVKVDGISHLPKLETFGRLNMAKIPKELLAMVIVFFKQIYETYKAEAGVRIFYNPRTRHYILDVPKQKISGAQVDWDNSHPPTGYLYAGTLHSHVAMSAFHSGIDKGSEGKLDGIHIVIGNVNTPTPSITGAVVINANRFKLCEDDILKYMDINIVEREEVVKSSGYCASSSVYEDYVSSKVSSHNSEDITAQIKSFKFRCLVDVDLSTVEVPQEWYDNIVYAPEVVYKFVDGKLVKGSKWSNTSNPYVPSETKYLPKPDPNYDYPPASSTSPYDDDTDYFPLIDNTICPKCRYREVAILAMNGGFVDDLMLTTVGCYGMHTDNDNSQYDLKYDSLGNMVDADGNIIISAKELEPYEAN